MAAEKTRRAADLPVVRDEIHPEREPRAVRASAVPIRHDSADAPAPGRRRRFVRPCVAVALAVGLCVLGGGGCAALPLAALGALSELTISAVSTGQDVYRLGKLDTAEMARDDQVILAAQFAAQDLHLKPRKDERRAAEGTTELTFADDKGAEVEARVDRRSETLTRVRVDVGVFGSQVTARLFLSRLRAHLPQSATPDGGGRYAPGW